MQGQVGVETGVSNNPIYFFYPEASHAVRQTDLLDIPNAPRPVILGLWTSLPGTDTFGNNNSET